MFVCARANGRPAQSGGALRHLAGLRGGGGGAAAAGQLGLQGAALAGGGEESPSAAKGMGGWWMGVRGVGGVGRAVSIPVLHKGGPYKIEAAPRDGARAHEHTYARPHARKQAAG